ncbi:MAG TPA: hypothetical protein VK550_12255 [Polyangiaceae bacterium]|nr:hypothetical protein [Polyangiaceae bacterium]
MPTVQVNGGIKFLTESQAIPGYFARFLGASAQVGKGQFATVSPATGYASLADGTVPGQISGGIGDFADQSDTSTVAGVAAARLTDRMVSGIPASTSSNDGFTDADFGVPFYFKDENTPGKLSNLSGSNRSLGGLVFGLDLNNSGAATPILWTGPVAHLLARATLVTNALIGGWSSHPVDAMASTTTAEKTMFRVPVHGIITQIRITSALGTIAADNTDYVTINVYKADGAAGTHVLVGSWDSRAANQNGLAAAIPESFALSAVAGALNLLETDIFTYEVLKGGAGKIVPVSTIEVVQKAI